MNSLQLNTALQQYIDAATRLKEAEDILKERQQTFDMYKYQILPGLMEEVALEEMKTDTHKFSLKSEIYVSLSKKDFEKRNKQFEKLEKLGLSALIKKKYNLKIDRDSDDSAALELILKEAGYDYTWDETVHHSTLKAALNEAIRQNPNLDISLFGITKDQVTIKEIG